jgi:lysophospholipid acyltransferase (LPLAT)-like uncharacterized protein
MKLSSKIIALFLTALYRLWCSTLRITVCGREAVDDLEAARRPMMFCLWHDELFALMHVRGTLRIITMVSQSRDGEYLAGLLQGLGLKTARGSSTRGGSGALLQAARCMRDEWYNGCMTVDGPRGPRHVVKQGAIMLAFRAPAHIVPVRVFYERAKEFRSWDRFQLPLPFSRVSIVFDRPYLPGAMEQTKEELERERLALENKLHALRSPFLDTTVGRKG